MHIAIDDTYGTAGNNTSSYVTSNRRTNLAVIFPDSQVQYIREQVKSCLADISEEYGIAANEFHFQEIYQRTGVWQALRDKHPNLGIAIFQVFASIYSVYKCTHLQHKSERTDIDNWFIDLALAMGIDCSDLSLANLPVGFDTNHIDILHQVDRIKKGIES